MIGHIWVKIGDSADISVHFRCWLTRYHVALCHILPQLVIVCNTDYFLIKFVYK